VEVWRDWLGKFRAPLARVRNFLGHDDAAASVQAVVTGPEFYCGRNLFGSPPDGQKQQWNRTKKTYPNPGGVLHAKNPRHKNDHAPNEKPKSRRLNTGPKDQQTLAPPDEQMERFGMQGVHQAFIFVFGCRMPCFIAASGRPKGCRINRQSNSGEVTHKFYFSWKMNWENNETAIFPKIIVPSSHSRGSDRIHFFEKNRSGWQFLTIFSTWLRI
jgi:hypothetical protein